VKDFGQAVRDRLIDVGCSFLRHGKGDHDIWITREGKADRGAGSDQIQTHREWHFERSGPFQGFLARGNTATVVVVRPETG
jgi:hypothetical protein